MALGLLTLCFCSFSSSTTGWMPPADTGLLYNFSCSLNFSASLRCQTGSRETPAVSPCTYHYRSIEVMGLLFQGVPPTLICCLCPRLSIWNLYKCHIWIGRVVTCVWDKYKFQVTLTSVVGTTAILKTESAKKWGLEAVAPEVYGIIWYLTLK